jgi:NADH:ubiquinone oxidoreductase subunit 6 (subunit J)
MTRSAVWTALTAASYALGAFMYLTFHGETTVPVLRTTLLVGAVVVLFVLVVTRGEPAHGKEAEEKANSGAAPADS